MTWMRTPKEEVHSVTSARVPYSDDVSARQRRYLVSMTIRTVCLVLAVVADGPLRWVLVAGAVLLPYVAVVMANAGRESGGRSSGGAGPEAPGAERARMLDGSPHEDPDR